MEHLTGKRYLWFAISLIVILPGLVSLILFGLNLGIDFTGGTLWEIQFTQAVTTEQVKEALADAGYDNTVVQTSSGTGNQESILIRMPEIQEGSAEKAALEDTIRGRLGDYTQLQISTIGASVGNAIRDRAILAVGLASIGILLYIAWAFRNTQNPWLYGTCALIAMLHDAIVVIGLFSILGEVADIQVDALFVTALLTVIGFSVHDTIVVFDRIRENLNRHVATTFEETVNYSLAQTIVRSINTSVTVVLTLLALYFYGGSTTREFVLVLLIGVLSGTYSSIFNASQFLVAWENGEIQRAFGRLRGRDTGPIIAPSR
jgi:preprotein translocase subunit SecF